MLAYLPTALNAALTTPAAVEPDTLPVQHPLLLNLFSPTLLYHL